MNTIIATRAGKDLISSLASGLAIGSRFGGALDEAASMFSGARDTCLISRACRPVEGGEQTECVHLRFGRPIRELTKSCSFWYHSQNQERQQPRPVRRLCVKECVQRHSRRSHSLLDYVLAVEKRRMTTLRLGPSMVSLSSDVQSGSSVTTLTRSGSARHYNRHPVDDIVINMVDVAQPRVLGRI
jgi:ATP citrate (pro-S)-lyase